MSDHGWRTWGRRALAKFGRALTAGLADDLRRQRREQVLHLKKLESRLAKAVERGAVSSARAAAAQRDSTQRVVNTLARQRRDILLMLSGSQATTRRTVGAALPTSAGELAAAPERQPHGAEIPTSSTLELSGCPVCEHESSTLVSEFNKLLLLDTAVDDAAKRYDNARCHRCGVVSARRRPTGARYRYLLNRFELTLGRIDTGESVPTHRTGSSVALTEGQRRLFRDKIAAGVFVSAHLEVPEEHHLNNLFHDRVNAARHVEIIGSLVPLRRPRVLELRPKLGALSEALRRLHGADVCTMPLFEVPQFIIEEAYGIPATHRLDSDHFTIPYDGDFDLIVANHVLTHAVRPRAMLQTIRERLRPGGHVYFYNEISEGDYLDLRASMFHKLNAFHLQTFNIASLVRTLAVGGFETIFVHRDGYQLLILARVSHGEVPFAEVTSDEQRERPLEFQRARDLAILKVPERLRGRFAGEWDAVVERAVSSGLAAFTRKGELRVVRRPRSARALPFDL